MILRMLIDGLLIMPTLVYFKLRSGTAAFNGVIVLAITLLSELFIVTWYARSIFTVSSVETIEQLIPKEYFYGNGF